jgi:hypothetical protein
MIIKRKWRVFLIIAVICVVMAVILIMKLTNNPRVSTEQFVRTYMINPSGTIASYLQDAPSTDPNVVAGREALSESLGLWLEYGIVMKDQKLFAEMTEQLRSKFMSPLGHIYWKLDKNGISHVTTNALGDDLRIVRTLLQAYELWNDQADLQLAKKLTTYLMDKTRLEGYLVDFYDEANHYYSPTLSLVYVDVDAFKLMKKHQLMNSDDYDKYIAILEHMPKGTLFYPKLYEIQSGKYTYDEKVNLIDQLIVALHLGETGMDNKPLLQFLQEQYAQHHKIYGAYDRHTLQPSVQYESPAVYALAILLALQQNDTEWAEKWHKRMLYFQTQHGKYAGGYVFDNNTHAFDNLFPLLAEAQLE